MATNGFKTILKVSYDISKDENDLPPVLLSPPEIQALYKCTKTDEVTDDVRLKYFKLPKRTSYPLDLNQGYEQFIFRRIQSPHLFLNEVIKFVLEAKEPIIRPGNIKKTSNIVSPSKLQPESELGKSVALPNRKLVLCHRGVLTRSMIIPYRLRGSPNNDNTFYATRYGGILHIIDPVDFVDERIFHTYHGKFEQMCFSDEPDLDPVTDVPVNRNDVTFGIFRSALAEFDLIYSAELSGVISDHKINDFHNLDEIKKCKFIQTKLMMGNSFSNNSKTLLWWTQLCLANTNDICIALRTAEGMVRTPVQHISVEDMVKNQKWKPEVCLKFLKTMLTLIEETMSDVDCPYTVYEFKFDSYAKCIQSKIHNGKTKLSFLPKHYIEHVQQQMNAK